MNEQPGVASPVTGRRPRIVSRTIPRKVEKLLWARAAGRCECAGCNTPLWKSTVSQEAVPVGQNAHIWSFSAGGPRGNEGIDKEVTHDPSNLILVCYPCHRRIDTDREGRRYTIELLQTWKREHETRIELVTGIDSALRSHVVVYGANVGAHSVHWSFEQLAGALFPERYPAEGRAIELGLINSARRDDEVAFWALELENLRKRFDHLIRSRVGAPDETAIRHVSVFALAPQPLLVALGAMLGDIVPADVYQLRRERSGWHYDEPPETGYPRLILEEPENMAGPPALVVGLSASVERPRIEEVLGAGASIWRLTAAEPHNDLITCREQLTEFRVMTRRTLDRIKRVHGQTTTLHVFPAMPVSVSVELGRVRSPKAEMPWRLYDQVAGAGFVPTLELLGDSIRVAPSGGEPR